LKYKLKEVQIEKDEGKKNIGHIEQRVEEVFNSIPDSAQEGAYL
jgi:hypothetical protein